MADAIEYHKKQYKQFLEEHKTQDRALKIGFHTDTDVQDAVPVRSNKRVTPHIGFIQ